MRFIYATGARPLEGFTIKRGIGIGGFGQVYYAVSDAGKEVALKHIQRNLDVELRGVSQCLNLKHPNLLALYDIRYDEAGEGWVVMEYVTGDSLRDVIERNPNGMPHDEIASWLAGTAAGVACLHDNGIVHRDLKPGNIFDDAGVVKVGDYGLSKFISTSRRSAQTESVGTFHYMAPEIGRGQYGREIDVYALGIILYEMLTGDVPFDGESSQEIIMKHLTASPELGAIPEPYRAAIERALEKDPEKRLSNVRELMQMLGMTVPVAGGASVIVPEPAVPPIRQESASATKQQDDEELVIGDDDADETLYIDEYAAEPPRSRPEMQFGPIEHRASNVPTLMAAANTTPPDEPIAKAVLTGWAGFVDWFSNPSVSTPLKVVLLVVGVIVALLNIEWLVPLGLVLAVIYATYYAIRAIVLSFHSERINKAANKSGSQWHESRGGRRRWQEAVRRNRIARPLQQQLTELTGSMLVSGAIVAVLSVVILIFAGQSMDGSLARWAPQLAWLAISGVAGAWAVLIPSKWWEGNAGDQIMRRFTMLAIGLALGAAAYGLDGALQLEMSYGPVHTTQELWQSFHAAGEPTLPAFLLYFGGLFVILRWWLQADPLRSTRISLWSIALAALWGLIFPFPQPWGILLAASMSVAVQLAAPWISSEQRSRMRQQFRLQEAQV